LDTCDLFIPNAFSPGDGNPYFEIYTNQVFDKFEVEIFDRWGELVYESDNQYFGWDGSYRANPAPMGVYVFTIRINDLRIQTGSITLIR
jgi:gliding motility-associated-like protein